jgi:hypothetical protein
MRYRAAGLLLALIAMVLSVGVWAETPTSQPSQAPTELLADGLEHLFQAARDHFAKQNLQAAATDIREAARLLKAEADHATSEEVKQALLTDRQALVKLADAVQQGTITAGADLQRAFAHAHYTLARHFHEQAKAAWLRKETTEAAHALQATVYHLEQGLTWTGEHIAAGTATVLDDARQLSGKLIAGTDYVLDQFGQAYEAVGKEIEKLSTRVEPAKKP